MRMNIPNKFNPFPVYKQGGSPEPPILPTITVDTIPEFVFNYTDSGTEVISSIVEYVTYTGQETLDYQLSGTLPSAISFASGSFNCVTSGIVSSESIDVNVLLSASDVASTAIAPVALSTYKQVIPPSPSINTPLTFTGKSSTNAVKLQPSGSPTSINLYYSKNGGQWTSYSVNTTIELSQGETVAFSGANDHFSKDSNNCYRFMLTGSIEGSGNLQSLMNWSLDLTSACFINLFRGCTSLLTTPDLPATGLANDCYYRLFYGCSNLTGTTNILPATTVAKNCYRSMYYQDGNLLNSPQIMLSTIGADYCCQSMFFQCYALTSIKVHFTSWSGGSNATNLWVNGINNSGTFYKPRALSENQGDAYIPYTWTPVNID